MVRMSCFITTLLYPYTHTQRGNLPLHPSTVQHPNDSCTVSDVKDLQCLCAPAGNWKRVAFAGVQGVYAHLYTSRVLPRRELWCSVHCTPYTRFVFPQTLIYIHIYTSLVKICTLHITVHTSHQLLANTRTLMKPKTTALEQAGGLVFPSEEVSLGYTF